MKDSVGRTIRVLRMGRSTHERLNAAPREAGEIHSAYARTLNLLWHDGRLLTLHGPGPLLAPFAAAVDHLPGELGPGMRAWREGEKIRLGPFLLGWDRGAVVETRLRPEGDGARLLLAALASRPAPRSAGGGSSGGSRVVGGGPAAAQRRPIASSGGAPRLADPLGAKLLAPGERRRRLRELPPLQCRFHHTPRVFRVNRGILAAASRRPWLPVRRRRRRTPGCRPARRGGGRLLLPPPAWRRRRE